MEVESQISKWYSEKAIFITGATGFMGKMLVEKLLRSCPNVGPIYILIRAKKTMMPQDRIEEIMASRVFDEIRATGVNKKNRLFPIPGDILLPDLGISVENKRCLQDTVSVVFHLAATVKFDEPLRIAVAINLEGSRYLMELCRGMTRVNAIVHVSTAYTNCNLSMIEEHVYPPPVDPEKVLHCVAGMNDDLLEIVTPRLIGNHPNTYTFTKALAEHVVTGYSTELPIVVVRPSIVSATWKAPTPGWSENMNGPNGLIVGAGKGMFKSMYGKKELIADLIPVDVCINLFIAAAWDIGTKERTNPVPNIRVYNCVSQPFKPLSWGEFVATIDNCLTKYAMSDVLTCPKIGMTDSRVKHTVISILEQTLPAFLADICTRLSGQRPRFRRYQYKLSKMATLLEFFTNNEFQFGVDNVVELKRRLNPVDQATFDFDMTEMNWEEYVTKYFLGIRKHVMNEKDDTIGTSRRRLIRWTLIRKAVQIGALAMVVIGYFQIYPEVVFWLDTDEFVSTCS